MSINRVGVIGAGVMGVGVAQSLAQAEYEVVLIDLEDSILTKAQKQIHTNVRLGRLLQKGPTDAFDPAAVLGRIHFTTTYNELGTADFVVENVVEQRNVKRLVYEQLEDHCPLHCIYAANTSAISITEIGAMTERPAQVVGMHFMNPVPQKPMVELIRGYHTSEETLAASRELLAGMGKESITVNDVPGFVSNRVLMLTINEAIFLVQDQVAQPEEIDQIFRSCFEHKTGPLETADLIGLDTILLSIEVLYESYNDSKYRPCPLLKKMVNAGLLGRKSGQGFYQYPHSLLA